MKRVLNLVILVTTISISVPSSMFSQQDTTEIEMIRLELKNGSTIVGDVIEENDSTLVIRTLSNIEMKIPKENITEREFIKGQIVEDEFWNSDPNKTRMFFAPTGRSLKAGKGYFSVYEIFFPFIAVGLTDWLTLSGGMSLLPGADKQLFYFAPKITPIQTTDFDASLGILYITIPDEQGAGIGYGVATYGNEKASLTLGLGFGFSGDEFEDRPIVVIGGDVRISKSVKFISENWIVLAGDVNLFSFGVRFFGENIAADFGLVFSNKSGSGFPFLPWLGFAYNF